jgi:hypothetical protein
MGVVREHSANAGTLSGGERIDTALNLRVGAVDRIPRHYLEQPILHVDETTAYSRKSHFRLDIKLDECAIHLLVRTPYSTRIPSSTAQVLVHRFSRLAALGNGPHHQRLPAPGVSGGENALHRGLIVLGGEVPAGVQLQPRLFD